MQSRRNAKAAKWFLRKLMRRWGPPRVLVTDKLPSYGVARLTLCTSADHRAHKGDHKGVEQSGRGIAPTHPTARED
ncbi:putative transposase, partial [Albidovulum inexpectatum]